MLSLRLPPELEERLNELAKQTHRSKTYYAARAIEAFLDAEEERLQVLSRWENVLAGKSELVPLEEIEKDLGLNRD